MIFNVINKYRWKQYFGILCGLLWSHSYHFGEKISISATFVTFLTRSETLRCARDDGSRHSVAAEPASSTRFRQREFIVSNYKRDSTGRLSKNAAIRFFRIATAPHDLAATVRWEPTSVGEVVRDVGGPPPPGTGDGYMEPSQIPSRSIHLGSLLSSSFANNAIRIRGRHIRGSP